MTFANLSAMTVLVGLGALAAALFAMQWLRVRHREIEVVTTLFWREAVEESQARVWWKRFRHPLAYLLILLLAALLWIAAGGPAPRVMARGHTVMLLDGSAGMLQGDRFRAATAALLDAANDVPPDERHVLLCAEDVRTLLRPGEEAAVLARRLELIEPSSTSSSLARAIEVLAESETARPARVLVFGDGPIPAGAVRDLQVLRVDLGEPASVRPRILSIGVAEARSGAWDRVDARVEVEGAAAEDIALAIDGTAMTLRSELDGPNAIVLRDLPAEGGVLSAGIGDRSERVVLARRPLIRVGISGEIPAPAIAALQSDPAVTLAGSGAGEIDVAIGSTVSGGQPFIRLVEEAASSEAIVIHYAPGEDAEAVLRRSVRDLGLDEIDATAIASAAGRPIVVAAREVEGGGAPGITVWRSLLTAEYDLVHSRSLPVFVGRAVRWLAQQFDLVPYVATDEAVMAAPRRWMDEDGRAFDPVGAPFVPPLAADYRTDDGFAIAAALAAPGENAVEASEDVALPGAGVDLVTWLLLAALALVFVEWSLHRLGRIP